MPPIRQVPPIRVTNSVKSHCQTSFGPDGEARGRRWRRSRATGLDVVVAGARAGERRQRELQGLTAKGQLRRRRARATRAAPGPERGEEVAMDPKATLFELRWLAAQVRPGPINDDAAEALERMA